MQTEISNIIIEESNLIKDNPSSKGNEVDDYYLRNNKNWVKLSDQRIVSKLKKDILPPSISTITMEPHESGMGITIYDSLIGRSYVILNSDYRALKPFINGAYYQDIFHRINIKSPSFISNPYEKCSKKNTSVLVDVNPTIIYNAGTSFFEAAKYCRSIKIGNTSCDLPDASIMYSIMLHVYEICQYEEKIFGKTDLFMKKNFQTNLISGSYRHFYYWTSSSSNSGGNKFSENDGNIIGTLKVNKTTIISSLEELKKYRFSFYILINNFKKDNDGYYSFRLPLYWNGYTIPILEL